MKKTILHAVIFSLIIHVLIIGFPLVKGYLLTKSYRPNIAESYDNVRLLQNEVAFGYVSQSGGELLLVLTFLTGIAFFMVGKYFILRLRSK